MVGGQACQSSGVKRCSSALFLFAIGSSSSVQPTWVENCVQTILIPTWGGGKAKEKDGKVGMKRVLKDSLVLEVSKKGRSAT